MKLEFGLQIEKKKSGDMYTGEYLGFISLDEIALSLFLVFVSQKIAEITRANEVRNKLKLVTDTHTTLTQLLEAKTKADFILTARKSLAKVIGYEQCGILYFAPKRISLH